MKTAEDYIRQINDRIMPHPHRLSRKQREVVKYLIGEIQKEAYNQALEDVAKRQAQNIFERRIKECLNL